MGIDLTNVMIGNVGQFVNIIDVGYIYIYIYIYDVWIYNQLVKPAQMMAVKN